MCDEGKHTGEQVTGVNVLADSRPAEVEPIEQACTNKPGDGLACTKKGLACTKIGLACTKKGLACTRIVLHIYWHIQTYQGL